MLIISKLNKATKQSFNGLKNAIQTQWAFKMECALLLISVPLAFYIASSAVEYILLIGSVLLILAIEIVNSSIEVTVNRIGMDYHELSGLAKDLASAAVFIAIVNAVLVWGILLAF